MNQTQRNQMVESPGGVAISPPLTQNHLRANWAQNHFRANWAQNHPDGAGFYLLQALR